MVVYIEVGEGYQIRDRLSATESSPATETGLFDLLHIIVEVAALSVSVIWIQNVQGEQM